MTISFSFYNILKWMVLGLFSLHLSSSFAQNSDAQRWAQARLDSMSLDEKIGQLFMLDVIPKTGEAHRKQVSKLIKDYHLGGVIYMKGDAQAMVSLSTHFDSITTSPLFYAIDGEWGVSMRLEGAISYPRQMTLGSIRNEEIIYTWGTQVGKEMHQLGLHINFAPVADVNTNINNPVIGNRSFGDQAEAVAKKSTLYMRGLQDAGILAVAKHFPGHGNTHLDSHYDLPSVDYSMEELEQHLLPFQAVIDAGISGVMSAHIKVPLLDSSSTPASLSPRVCTQLLRDSMGFQGLLFSDALNMKGATQSADKPAVSAFLAGNDVLLFPANIKQAILDIKQALTDSIISEEQINERCTKILRYKYKYGLSSPRRYNHLPTQALISSAEGHVLNEDLIQQSLVLVKNENDLLPISSLSSPIPVLTFGRQSAQAFEARCQFFQRASYHHLPFAPQKETLKKLQNILAKDTIVILTLIPQNSKVEGAVSATTLAFIDSLIQNNTKVILTLLGNPYGLQALEPVLPKLHSVILAHSTQNSYQEAAAEVIFGGMGANGTLPVSISPTYQAGHGLTCEAIRMGYAHPAALDFNLDSLALIDTIVHQAITDEATPGCQVLIVSHGKVIWNKAYGHHAYDKKRAVELRDVYDLASITKVTSTLSAIMHLYEQQHISLDDTLGQWFPQASTAIQALSIKELLSHQSGLPAYIPFFLELVDREALPESSLFSRKRTQQHTLRLHEYLYGNSARSFKPHTISDKKEAGNQVLAKNLYVHSEVASFILDSILSCPLSDKTYRYSDLNFILLHELANKLFKQGLEQWYKESITLPLGAHSLCFNPYLSIPLQHIVPTEQDDFYRGQLIHGYVHDRSAALLGGVSGHAGLFSNASDLAKYFQMLLAKGSYGGMQFYKAETIDLFTSKLNGDNRRGLGFDKPEPDSTKTSPVCSECSLESYGHSGFTGTLAWVDPRHQLVYIFLSNRIHPYADNTKLIKENIRTRIQEQIYRSMLHKNAAHTDHTKH